MFRLEWDNIASMQLFGIVRGSSPQLRRKIRAAIDQIELAMLNDPSQVGESRTEGMRYEVFEPLTIWFTVNVRLQQVQIVRVRIPPKWMD